MAGLTVKARTALAGILGMVPDNALEIVLTVIRTTPGQRAREVESLAYVEVDDRRRRAQALGALAPLFRARTDGLPALTFPPLVLPRLWRAACDRQPDAIALLDRLEEDQASFRALGRMRIFEAAQAVLNETPDMVWPPASTPGGEEERQAGLAELRACCALGPLSHRALPQLGAWSERPDDDQTAELRVVFKDAMQADVDGLRRLMDILAAHLDQPATVVRLALNTAVALGHEALLKSSELAVYIERALTALDAVTARVLGWKPGEATNRLVQDLASAATLVQALDNAVADEPQGEWARRVGGVKQKIAGMIDDRLKAAPKAVARVLPTRDAPLAGRGSRKGPDVNAPVDAATALQARGLVDLVAAVRVAAARFGCESRRQGVFEGLTTDICAHIDQSLEAIRLGEAKDAGEASARLYGLSELLERLGAPEAAVMKRRVAALSTAMTTGADDAANARAA